jgi:hypothetical protein
MTKMQPAAMITTGDNPRVAAGYQYWVERASSFSLHKGWHRKQSRVGAGGMLIFEFAMLYSSHLRPARA